MISSSSMTHPPLQNSNRSNNDGGQKQLSGVAFWSQGKIHEQNLWASSSDSYSHVLGGQEMLLVGTTTNGSARGEMLSSSTTTTAPEEESDDTDDYNVVESKQDDYASNGLGGEEEEHLVRAGLFLI